MLSYVRSIRSKDQSVTLEIPELNKLKVNVELCLTEVIII